MNPAQALPNAHSATVEQTKISDYLLNAGHPDNGGKAAFFARLGFTSAQWQGLASALQQHAVGAAVVKTMQSVHGQKFVVEGLLAGPTTSGEIRSIWIIEAGQANPRLVTAYPHG